MLNDGSQLCSLLFTSFAKILIPWKKLSHTHAVILLFFLSAAAEFSMESEKTTKQGLPKVEEQQQAVGARATRTLTSDSSPAHRCAG